MEKYVTQVKIILSIFGDIFNPQKFSKFIDITPTDMWNKGDEIPPRKGLERKDGTKHVRKESVWEYSTDFIQTLSFEEVSKIILEKFDEQRVAKIRSYIEKEKGEIKLDVVVEIVDNQSPSLSLSKDLITLLNSTGAEIDFDIYVLENEKSKVLG